MTESSLAPAPGAAARPAIAIWPVTYVYLDRRRDRFVSSTDVGMPRAGDVIIRRHSGAHADSLATGLADVLNGDPWSREQALNSPRAVTVRHATLVLRHRVVHVTPSPRRPR